MPYHHGDLPRALVAAALEDVGEVGPAATSLRRIAKAAGVSHTAAAHHFRDKAGLLTAVAVEGHRLLAAALAPHAPDFLRIGLAYARFALEHPAHFAVMYRPELLHVDDPDLLAARAESGAPLRASTDVQPLALAGWGLMHGLATLYLTGNLAMDDDAEFLAAAEEAALAITRLPGR